MRKFIIVIFIIVSNIADSQNRNSIWCFGDSAGIDFNNLANPTTIASGGDGRGNCVSIADTNGNLLFYATENSNSDAVIYNKNHALMANTGGMPSDGYYAGMVIIPKPDSDSLYYLFYHGNNGNVDTTYYAVLDMSLNSGLGGVIQKNITIAHYRVADCVTAVKHGNGRDWWFVSKLSGNPPTNFNRFYVYLITPDSIYLPIIQNLGSSRDFDFQKVCWHPSYNKFMLINPAGYMAEYDFDRCTGIITLNRTIFPEQPNNYNRIFWEGAYSPNGNVFYISRNSYGGNFGHYNYLLQYDLTATNIPASGDTLNFTSYPLADCGAVRLAPDGKIYYTQAYIPTNALNYPYADTMRNYINENLGVVNNPDVVGPGCNFAPFSFHLGGKRTYWGLPNNPDYSLGRLLGSACDTLQWVSTPETPKPPLGGLMLTYIAAWQKLFVNAQNLNSNFVTITIYDARGSLKVQEFKSSMVNAGYFTLDVDCAGWASGLYVVHLETDKERLTEKFIKE